MTTHDLTITLNRVEGALVRVLGLAERRGFTALALAAEPDGDRFRLSLTVASTRPIEQLLRQLDKLFDVHHADLAAPALCEVAK